MKKDNFIEFHICSENKFNQKNLFIVNGSINIDLNKEIKKISLKGTKINLSLKVNF